MFLQCAVSSLFFLLVIGMSEEDNSESAMTTADSRFFDDDVTAILTSNLTSLFTTKTTKTVKSATKKSKLTSSAKKKKSIKFTSKRTALNTTKKTTTTTTTTTDYTPIPLCPGKPKGLNRVRADMKVRTPDMLTRTFPSVQRGGLYVPGYCKARSKIAIIVPFRDQYQELSIFLYNMHRMLQRQMLHYRIYIVNQDDTTPYSRATLMNIGYIHAMRSTRGGWDCLVFQDVDLIPEDHRNMYACRERPTKLCTELTSVNSALNKTEPLTFGRATIIPTDLFRGVNGFTNKYRDWYKSDQNMVQRLAIQLKHVDVPQRSRGRCLQLSPIEPEETTRLNNATMEKVKDEISDDGVSTTTYSNLTVLTTNKMFTLLNVNLGVYIYEQL